MVDPVLVSVAGVGASVVKFLLRASGQDAVAGLVGDAQEGLGLLAGLRGRVNDRGGAVAKCIEKTVADRVRGMYQKCQDRGVGTERLDGVATGVGGLLDRVGNDDRFIVEAVRSPDRFAAMLHRRGEPIRAQLFARSEPYFDELVDAVAAEYVRLAPWSEKFQIEALKYVMGALDRIEEGVGKIQEDVGKGLENDALILESLEIVKENQNATIGGLPRPGRVVFGARPDVAAGFRERVEQGTLRGLVVDGVQERVVLVGMAGCGKSQLASSLARECGAAGWGLVAWLNASSADSVRSDLVELARRLGVDTSDNPTQDQVIERCLGHLQSADAGDRLVVFDNVEDFDDLTGVVPRGGGLRVVATSRRRDVSSAWEAVEVGVFPRADSIAFVQSITGSQDSGAADALAARLGDLPLALAQAAETARIERWSLAEYLDQLDAYSSDRVIHRIPGDSYPDDVSWALLLAVDSALSRIKDGSHEAAGLQVGALAVLAESGVPTRWIAPGARKAQTDGNADGAGEGTNADAGPVGETTKVRAAAAENARRALAALLNASVVQQSTDRGVTMVHRFQGQVLRENWNPGEWAGAFGAATDLLDRIDIDSLPREDAEGRRREARDLIEQLRAIAAQDYSHPLFERERVRACLHHAFVHADDLGFANEALTLHNAVDAVQNALGPDHPDTLALGNALAAAYQRAGRLSEAIPLFEKVVADCERILGVNHRNTLASRHNLANAYQETGRLDEAIALLEEVVTDRVRVLGADHADTLASQNCLAIVYQAMGTNDKAIALFEETYVQRSETLGITHPDTLKSQNSLAIAYRAAGRDDDAVSLLEDTLADRVRVLGDDHPNTLTSRGNLAAAYYEVGRLSEAIPLYEEVLADRVRVLGGDHPQTLTSRNNLAYAYESAGRLGEAIPLYEEVLADRVRVLGEDHPDTLASRNNLAGAYHAVGRLDDARALLENTLKVCEEVLSPGHPLTTRVRENLETLEREMNQPPAPSPESSEE